MLLNYLFLLNISLLFVHEMDAIRRKEWKMFIFLKDLKEELGYLLFTSLHIPIYFFILLFLVKGGQSLSFNIYLVTNTALIVHLLVHLLFTRHKNNEFWGLFSRLIIYLMGTIALLHLILLFLL